jgi:hypothetical protein
MTERQLATVLAALRFFQAEVIGHPERGYQFVHFDEVGGPLTSEQIDELCEFLNTQDSDWLTEDHSKDCPCVCHKNGRFEFLQDLCKCNTTVKEPLVRSAMDALHHIRMDAAGEGMKTDRDALIAIRDYPANANSDPDVMAAAIEAMQAIGAAQLDGDDWEVPS